MTRLFSLGVMLVTFVVLSGQPAISAAAAQPSSPRVSFIIPTSNVASSGPVLDDRHVVYGVATPRLHRSVCVSCGRKPFTNFRVQVYIRDYQRRSTSVTVSQPRLLFEGARGVQIHIESLSGGWLVYDTDMLQNIWQLFARNVVTGRVILLDSSQLEGVPNVFSHASSDGRAVVWQSSRQIYGPTMSGIWSYTLATGRRQLLPSGGTGADYYYTYPQIAGNHLILVQEGRSKPSSQIFEENLATQQVRPLTPPGQVNAEPFISGNLVAWVHGQLTLGHRHGLVVANLATGRRVALQRSSSQLPQVAAGRYVVFAPDYPTPYPKGSVEVYDALTGQRRTIATGPDASGFVPNWYAVKAGGSAALVRMDKPCSASNNVCPTYFVLISLGPV